MKSSRNLAGNIRIADLRHNIVLVRIVSQTLNALGHPTYTTSSTTVPARIRMMQNAETEIVDKQTVVQMPEIVVRHTSLTTADWIEWESKKYDIVSIDDTKHPRRFLIIKAKAVI